mmetsp:Transcript_107890/g.337482  ORF Transcript_107890/g.337482 Transcript_107890/m.337482 type:complete len:288 (+) Transcript_107890:113-976(+)
MGSALGSPECAGVRNAIAPAHKLLQRPLPDDVKWVVYEARSDLKLVPPQTGKDHDDARHLYLDEKPEVAQRYPELRDATVTAFLREAPMVGHYVGYVEGLTGAKLNLRDVAAGMRGDAKKLRFDAQRLEDFSKFFQKVRQGECTFRFKTAAARGEGCAALELQDAEAVAEAVAAEQRSEGLLTSMLPVMKDLQNVLREMYKTEELQETLYVPLRVANHVVKMCTPPFLGLLKQLAREMYHVARKSSREEDLAQVHFMVHAWLDLPLLFQQWYTMGFSLGVLCLVFLE